MRFVLIFMTFFGLSGCVIVEPDPGYYSLDEIIALRLADDQRINGKEIVVDSMLSLTVKKQCLAVEYRKCLDEQEKIDLSQYEKMNEYGHERRFSYECGQGVLRLLSDDKSEYEAIDIDYDKHGEFQTLMENKELWGTFEIKVEFTDEIDYCDNKIYKGTMVTLTEGGYQKVLQLLAGRDDNK